MGTSHPEPPDELDTDLELDPKDWAPRQVYYLMTGLVIPRPIAWVSTYGPDRVRNVAPHSYFNVVAHDPPHVVFSSSGLKDTLRNLRDHPEFVVNVVTMDVLEPMNFTATDFPRDEDEFTWAGLTEQPAHAVDAPRVAEAAAHLECRVVQEVPAGNATIIVGEVVHLHVTPRIWAAGRVDPQRYDPVCRLAGTQYARLGELIKLPRPTWADVQGTEGQAAMPRLP